MRSKLALYVCLLLIFASVCVISGCASIVNGNPSLLDINTIPSNVKVTLTGIENGEKFTQSTPCVFTMSKGSDYSVLMEYHGYKSEEIVIRRGINGWFWGNILLGGIVGMVIDGVSQNMWDHNLHTIKVEMQKLEATGQLPDQVTVEYPVTVTYEDGSTAVVYLPIKFIKNT